MNFDVLTISVVVYDSHLHLYTTFKDFKLNLKDFSDNCLDFLSLMSFLSKTDIL